MKRSEDRAKLDEDHRRREAERQHPSTRGERPLAPVIPLRPEVEEKPDEAS